MAIGTNPDPDLVGTLVERCAVEPDFYVRDMLTWALTRFPSAVVVPPLLAELRSENVQARSQSLHTLSKIRDASAWPSITDSLLCDPDDEVARSAWRAAVVLVPEGQMADLAGKLASQLGRGNRQTQLSLSRALVALGKEAVEPILQRAKAVGDPVAHAHASATERLLRNPDAAFLPDIKEAKRMFVLGKER